jgi:hypothetical protein
MEKEFGRSSVKTETAVVRVKMKGPEAAQFLLVNDALLEPGAHEDVKTRFRSHGPHCLRHGDEWSYADPPCGQHNIVLRIEDKSVAQGADKIQGFPCLPAGEPLGPFPDEPVKDLEAEDSVLSGQAMHAEGPSQQGVCLPVAANIVKLARDRGKMILGNL